MLDAFGAKKFVVRNTRNLHNTRFCNARENFKRLLFNVLKSFTRPSEMTVNRLMRKISCLPKAAERIFCYRVESFSRVDYFLDHYVSACTLRVSILGLIRFDYTSIVVHIVGNKINFQRTY